MRIEVTAEDIENGRQFDPKRCAVALACRRAGLPEASVVPSDCIFWGRDPETGLRRCVPTPRVVHDFAREFDRGNPVEPFAFDLDIGPETY